MPEPTNAQKLAEVDRMLDDAGQRLYTLEAENERLRSELDALRDTARALAEENRRLRMKE